MELKFRAWNKIDKVMIKDLNSPVMMHGVLLVHSDDIIMQFTGLTDKNGQDIYEGDILCIQFQDGHVSATVSYSINNASWEAVGCKDIQGYPFTMNQVLATKMYKVIGNIHQHPELMESDDE